MALWSAWGIPALPPQGPSEQELSGDKRLREVEVAAEEAAFL